MNNKLITLVMTVIVGVILAGSLLVPVLNDATDALHVTKTNDFGVYANVGSEDLTISCAVNSEDNTKWDFTVNDTTINFPVSGNSKWVLVTDTFCMDLESTGITIATASNARFTGQASFSGTIADGTLTGTSTYGENQTHSFEQSYTWAFYASESGDYRSFYLNSSDDVDVYYTDLNDIYGASFTFTTNKFFSLHGDVVNYYAVSGTATEINANVNYDNVPSTMNMKVLDLNRTTGDYTFVVDNSGTDYTVHPWMFIVPASVTSDAIQNPGAIAALYGVIPIMVIVALLVVAVGVVARKND